MTHVILEAEKSRARTALPTKDPCILWSPPSEFGSGSVSGHGFKPADKTGTMPRPRMGASTAGAIYERLQFGMTDEGIKALESSAYERDGVCFAGTKGFAGGFAACGKALIWDGAALFSAAIKAFPFSRLQPLR